MGTRQARRLPGLCLLYALVGSLAPWAGEPLPAQGAAVSTVPASRHAAAMSAADVAALHAALDAYDRGDATTAEPALLRLTQRYPGSYEAAEALGSLYAEAGNTQGALPLLKRATRLAAGESLAWSNLGAAYLRAGQTREAVTAFTEAQRLDPASAGAEENLGKALLAADSRPAAMEHLRRASELAPEDAGLRYALALALFEETGPDAGKRAAEAADVLEGIPAAARTPAMVSLAADANERAERFEAALRDYEAVAHASPTETNLYALCAELLRHWNWAEAITVATYAQQRYPASSRFEMAKGVAYFGESEFSKAVGVFSTMLEASPNDAGLADLLGRSCGALADGENAACGGVLRFAEAHPGNAVMATYAAAAMLHTPEGLAQLPRAEALLRSAMAADPKYAEAYLQMGVLDQVRGQWTESAGYLEQAIALRPGMAQAHYRLSRAYAHTGRREEAQAQIALQQEDAKQEKEALDRRMAEVMRFVMAPAS